VRTSGRWPRPRRRPRQTRSTADPCSWRAAPPPLRLGTHGRPSVARPTGRRATPVFGRPLPRATLPRTARLASPSRGAGGRSDTSSPDEAAKQNAEQSCVFGNKKIYMPSVGASVRLTEPEQNAFLFGAAVCLSREETMHCQGPGSYIGSLLYTLTMTQDPTKLLAESSRRMKANAFHSGYKLLTSTIEHTVAFTVQCVLVYKRIVHKRIWVSSRVAQNARGVAKGVVKGVTRASFGHRAPLTPQL